MILVWLWAKQWYGSILGFEGQLAILITKQKIYVISGTAKF
jgi:hypothetical protein